MAKELKAVAKIEAALYASGRPLELSELIRVSGTGSQARTINMLSDIMQRVSKHMTALEVAKLPDETYVLQLKPEYGEVIRKFASRPLLPRAIQKTLSYIAFMQPVSTKQLVETRGNGVYSHLKELRRLDFVTYQEAGRLKIYSTTDKFGSYFGIHDSHDLKQKLFKKMRTKNK